MRAGTIATVVILVVLTAFLVALQGPACNKARGAGSFAGTMCTVSVGLGYLVTGMAALYIGFKGVTS